MFSNLTQLAAVSLNGGSVSLGSFPSTVFADFSIASFFPLISSSDCSLPCHSWLSFASRFLFSSSLAISSFIFVRTSDNLFICIIRGKYLSFLPFIYCRILFHLLSNSLSSIVELLLLRKYHGEVSLLTYGTRRCVFDQE